MTQIQVKNAVMPKQLTGSLPADYIVFHQMAISPDVITGLVCVQHLGFIWPHCSRLSHRVET